RGHGHVAADEEGEPTEHLLLGKIRLAGDQLADAFCEVLVVRHHPILGSLSGALPLPRRYRHVCAPRDPATSRTRARGVDQVSSSSDSPSVVGTDPARRRPAAYQITPIDNPAGARSWITLAARFELAKPAKGS